MHWIANKSKQYRLVVFTDKSVLIDETGEEHIFQEGPTSSTAEENHRKVISALSRGFLDSVIRKLEREGQKKNSLGDEQKSTFIRLLDSVTSEVGRALIGITVLQLCIKTIAPTQTIRLHKANSISGTFSWKDGISMRTLDKQFITPTLRKHELLRLNADGFMMTRTLAENYPYSKVYKAALRGGRDEWLEIVDWLENDELDPIDGLEYLISLMIEKREGEKSIQQQALKKLNCFCAKEHGLNEVKSMIKRHIEISDYRARLFEISIHSLFQVFDSEGVLEGKLKPLTQMRSANKKHGNVGDVEVVSPTSENHVYEAWDPKYGKTYLFEELGELKDKLEDHDETKVAGFIVNAEPRIDSDVANRIEQIKDELGVEVLIRTFDDFIEERCHEIRVKGLGNKWITAYAETLAQKRRELAPVDEPCEAWLRTLISIFEEV